MNLEPKRGWNMHTEHLHVPVISLLVSDDWKIGKTASHYQAFHKNLVLRSLSVFTLPFEVIFYWLIRRLHLTDFDPNQCARRTSQPWMQEPIHLQMRGRNPRLRFIHGVKGACR